MKRVFLDMYLAHNLGDDLFLHIVANRYPNCRFTINYYDNKYDEFIKNYRNIEKRLTLQKRILRKLKIKDYIYNIENIAEKNDALVFLSGSYFMEPIDKNNNEYNRRKELIDTFKLKGKKVYILGSNFGPYSSEEFYNNWNELFCKCDDICFREQYSYNLFKKLKNVRISNDIVLGLNVDKFKNNKKEKIVGYSIVDVLNKRNISDYYEEYIKSIIKSINLFVKNNYKCVLMSFCENEGDMKVINDIMKLLDKNTKMHVDIFEYKNNLEDAISLINKFEIFVATRFHAIILGLLLDICTMPIIYSNKTLNVLNDLNLQHICIEMKCLNKIYDKEYIKQRLKHGNKLRQNSKTNDQFKLLDKLLK